MSVGKDGFAVKVKDVLSAGGAGSDDSVLENGRWDVEDILQGGGSLAAFEGERDLNVES